MPGGSREGALIAALFATGMSRVGIPTVLFVGLARGAGGSTRSLTTILDQFDSVAHRVVAAPANGGFHELGHDKADEWIDIDSNRYTRWCAMLRVAFYAWKNRRTLAAVHANGLTAINVAAPAALIAGVPLLIWVHNSELSFWSRRFAVLWRRTLPNAIWAVVSPTARELILEGRLARAEQVSLVPNPIDPARYLARRTEEDGRVRICYLAGASLRKGFDLLPSVITGLQDMDCQWLIYTSAQPREAEVASAFEILEQMPDRQVTVLEKVRDAREIYSQCDIVFMPTRIESFGRVAAEAMLNGIPVVASDLPALRDVLGNEEAGLMFRVGDARAAADELRRLVRDKALRKRLGEEGKRRAARFEPRRVAKMLAELYGIRFLAYPVKPSN